MPEAVHTKVAIIGSGPAGLTAAIYASRASLEPIVISGTDAGGQLMWTTEVENFPGFPKGIVGPELMGLMREQAERFGTKFFDGNVTKVDLQTQPARIWRDDQEITADTVIIATGASALWLQLPNEQRLRGKGVSACATCDGFFFKGKEVIVVGGGDSAMEEALYLTKFATKVTVIVRTDKLRASKIMADRAQAHPQISFQWNSTVADVLGDQSISGVVLENTINGQRSEFACQGMFLAIGHKPNTDIFQGQLDVDAKGYLIVKNQVLSSLPHVFIAGDVADYRYRQAITAAGWGCMAALEAEKFTMGHHA